ncbi:TIGR02996 domain-containing protein [Gemmata sp. JC717]|uniref:TIGR02996 domain-containing protein n=1 Tax=Gemmata algarum TaxID=2975278 RepID=UPI0021BA571D|nr:TIGR02996 domain-containing protein [Gemmata algarum]MDY3555553.1 TIGR02996 domain-containing protein [Gemmata algarum]
MNDRDSLLAAVLEHPEEDTPRLMYADWLQENGDPDRGQFVRLQVEGAHAEPYSPQARECEVAAQHLLERHRGTWTRHLLKRAIGWQFVRGFVEHVGLDAATFGRDAAALFAAEPVRSVQVVRFALTVAHAPLSSLFGTPQLTRVTRLDFSKLGHDVDYFERLAECPQLGALTDLNFRSTPVPVQWLRAFLAGPALPALRALDLADIPNLSRVLAESLPRADHRRFTKLDLSYIPFKSDEVQKALASRCVRWVEELRLGWRPQTGPGPLSYLDLGFTFPWERLRLLDLEGQQVGDNGVREIVAELGRCRTPPPLRWLGLAQNGLGSEAIHTLVNADPRVKLYHLDLRENKLTSGQRAALQDRFPEAEILV